MKFQILIVHNSDEVKDCFIGEIEEEILIKLKKSEYNEEIELRLEELGEKLGEKYSIYNLDNITRLYHDGDSEDGYILLQPI